MRLAHIPNDIIRYVENLYQKIRVCIRTENFITRGIDFKVGVFQGDTLSPIIFLLAINPLLKAIQQNSSLGYQFRGKQVVALAFADDLTLCFRNKKTAQFQLQKINKSFATVGLTLKPTKCQSLSICSGRPSNISFKILDEEIGNIFHGCFKFLGAQIFSHNQRGQVTNLLKDSLQKHLKSVDELPLRGSYKIRIYSMYVTSVLRFPLMVQDVSTNGLKEIDRITTKFLRKWTKLPHSTTTGLLLHEKGMNIQLPSDIYDQGHVVMESNPSDDVVTEAIAEKVEHPRATRSNFRDHIANNNSTKNKKSLKQERNKDIEEHASTQETQGQWNQLVHLQADEVPFKALTYGLSEATFRWLHKAATDTLPCGSYLRRINRVMNNACNLCGHSPESLKHVLNSCPYSLTSGRYSWRHDSILKFLKSSLSTHHSNPDSATITADLPNNYTRPTQSTRTIPEDILLTEQRPDLTIINRKIKQITLVELSVCWDQDNAQARARKEIRYEQLIAELEERRWTTSLVTLEIGSRGFSSNSTASALKSLFPLKRIRATILTKMNQIAINCSHKLFQERSNQHWIALNLLEL